MKPRVVFMIRRISLTFTNFVILWMIIMAKLTEDLMKETLNAHQQEGETLKHWAFGIKQPSILLMVPLFALAILPGVIATQMLTKNYLIGLTDKRLVVLQIKSIANAELKAVTEYAMDEFKATPGSFKAGKLFTYLTIDDASGRCKT